MKNKIATQQQTANCKLRSNKRGGKVPKGKGKGIENVNKNLSENQTQLLHKNQSKSLNTPCSQTWRQHKRQEKRPTGCKEPRWRGEP